MFNCDDSYKLNRAFDEYVIIKNVTDILKSEAINGWILDLLATLFYKECGVYNLYNSNERLDGKFVSDMIANAFYSSETLDEFYHRITYILFKMESR